MSDDDKVINPPEGETQPVDADSGVDPVTGEDDQPPASGEDAGPQRSDEELFMAALNGEINLGDEDYTFAPIKRGQTLKGTVAGKTETEILVDVGVKSEGIVTGRELEELDADTRQSLRIGDEIMVFVLAQEDSSGHLQLSLKRAMEAKDWEEAEDYMKDAKLYESKVIGFNKGGLIVRFGKLRGFVPASQVSRERQMRVTGESPEERWSAMVNEDISIKVIEVDRGRKRLILSERAASKELRAQKRSDLMSTLAVGQIHTGRVISLTDFGAFVDLGGADGLIHLSELSWEHIKHPKEVLKVGEEVEVEIINIDNEKQRIGLSRKKMLDDPWLAIASEFKPDQLVQGTVTKLTKFGAFARLVDRPEIEGLIHISELSDKRIAQAREVVEEGQVVTLRVLEVNTERRRLALSLKRAMSEAYMDSDWHEVMEAVNEDTPPTDDKPAKKASRKKAPRQEKAEPPADETLAPADEMETPVAEVATPAVEAEASVAGDAAPPDEIASPVAEAAPAVETEAPVDEAAVSQDTAEAPVDESAPLAEEAAAPTNEAAASQDTAEPPVDESAPPAEETAAPTDEAAVSQDTAEAPVDEAAPPAEETAAPTDEAAASAEAETDA